VKDVPLLHSKLEQLKTENQQHNKMIAELDYAFRAVQEENKKLNAQICELEQRVEQAEIRISDMTIRTKKIVQGM